MKFRFSISILFALSLLIFCSCSDDESEPTGNGVPEGFYFGADLSYVNQIEDHNGVYKDQGETRNPYRIFKDHGTNLVRLRLWHNPVWTEEVYGEEGDQMYNDIKDVEKSIMLAKEQGMDVLLDFHYSDIWADPGKQEIPAAWMEIEDLEVLKDSIYNYTFKMLSYLDGKGLMPELVQAGNEINCGMLYTNAPTGFPNCEVCDESQWKNLGDVLNSAIDAVRDVAADTKVILHVADPKNVEWWFSNIRDNGQVTDFDIIGFSYYPLWHPTVSVGLLSGNISKFKSDYGKEVLILETAYPWTTQWNDNYDNSMGGESPITGYPYSQKGQADILQGITQEVIDGGGSGIIYWEPGWISSDMKDLWGTGSSWENCALFDFDGNPVEAMGFTTADYK